jgi:hypothetical protein
VVEVVDDAELARQDFMPVLHEVVADFIGEHGVVEIHLWNSGDGAQDDVLDAWLGGSGHRNCFHRHSLALR